MATDVERVTGDGGEQPEHAEETAQTQTEGASEGSDGKKGRKSTKEDFVVADAKHLNAEGALVSAINGDGLLIAVPGPVKSGKKGDENREVLYAGWNIRKHVPLKKSHFADEVTYILYTAFVCKVKAAVLFASAEQKEARARNLQKFGNEKQRKDANKLIKMRAAMKLLTKQLKDDGVDISGLED